MSNEMRTNTVPRLRFPEFRNAEEWTSYRLGDFSTLITEKTGKKVYRLLSVTSGIGLVSQLAKFGREIAGESYKNYIVIRRGDFAYNKSSTKSEPEGQVALLENEEVGAVPNSIFTCFRVDRERVLPHFLKYPFASNVHGRWLRKFIAVGARANGALAVDSKDLLATPIRLPLPAEQQKIADCLSSLDDLIGAESQKLEALRVHKRGLMQGLFPAEAETVPKLRFAQFEGDGEWEKQPIGSIVDLLSGYPFKGSEISEDSSGVPLMRGINVTEGFIRHTQDIDRYYLGDVDRLEKFRLSEDDLVIGMDGSKVGRNSSLISAKDSDALLIQRVARLRARSKATIRFIFQQINSSVFHSYVDRINTSGGIPHISATQINEFEICFPSEREQATIADTLSSLDDLITAQLQQIESLKTHKRGLMQGLFPASA